MRRWFTDAEDAAMAAAVVGSGVVEVSDGDIHGESGRAAAGGAAMSEPTVTNAIIEDISINDAERGLLTAWLHLKYGDGSGQGFGGFALYLPETFTSHTLLSHAGHFIWRCMEIGGVTQWSDLKGKAIRVRKESRLGCIQAIGHITKDDWFCPKEDFVKAKEGVG